ncbi:hypothetical protein CYMTET_50859 [Cymbomonas tetramitiformis]|uniref:Uncharacterized protein n=1 Tax=Cymbomonas tetramitiformis TaxID=36881 RepID=A0AAE0BNZ1_9CHLO|nr:hypothetical protein CYMTET_50859 [Cymbomonas tetramitiformis]
MCLRKTKVTVCQRQEELPARQHQNGGGADSVAKAKADVAPKAEAHFAPKVGGADGAPKAGAEAEPKAGGADDGPKGDGADGAPKAGEVDVQKSVVQKLAAPKGDGADGNSKVLGGSLTPHQQKGISRKLQTKCEVKLTMQIQRRSWSRNQRQELEPSNQT